MSTTAPSRGYPVRRRGRTRGRVPNPHPGPQFGGETARAVHLTAEPGVPEFDLPTPGPGSRPVMSQTAASRRSPGSRRGQASASLRGQRSGPTLPALDPFVEKFPQRERLAMGLERPMTEGHPKEERERGTGIYSIATGVCIIAMGHRDAGEED